MAHHSPLGPANVYGNMFMYSVMVWYKMFLKVFQCFLVLALDILQKGKCAKNGFEHFLYCINQCIYLHILIFLV